jgi:hypothetical protein
MLWSMRADQCREARTILKWTRRELAEAAGVTPWVVAAFEDGREVLPVYEFEIRAALLAAGIGFPVELVNGQFKAAGVTYSPRGAGEGK